MSPRGPCPEPDQGTFDSAEMQPKRYFQSAAVSASETIRSTYLRYRESALGPPIASSVVSLSARL